MKNISNSIILILVSFVVLSCGGNKSGSSKKSKVDKTPPESKLNQARNSFVEKELRPMKKEIELALKSLNTYREYEESVRSLEALPLVELKKVKNTFIKKHGSEAKEVKLKVSGLKSQISENKKELIKIRKDIQKNELVFNEKKSSVEQCFENLSEKQTAFEKEVDRRKKSIESTQVRITKESGKIEGLAKSAIKKTFHKKTVYKVIKQYGKYLTDVGESLEKNKKVSREKPTIAQLEKKIKKAPTAVLRSRLRKKEKRKIEETFNQFDRVEALIRSVYKQSGSLTSYAKKQNGSITKAHNLCKKKQTNLLALKDEIELIVTKFNDEKLELENNTSELIEYVKLKEPFYSAYNEYKLANDKFNGEVQESLEKKKALFEIAENKLVKKYSQSYLKIYDGLVKWVTSNSIDGKKTLELLDLIDRSMHTSSELLAFKTKIVEILTLANSSDQKISRVKVESNYRSIANFFGIKTPSLNVKINLPKIKLPKLRLPKIKIPKLDIKLPKFGKIDLNFDLKLNIQEIELPNIEIANIDISKVIDIDLGSLEIAEVEIEIPEVIVISEFITNLGQFGESFIDDITNLEINAPKVEIVRIEADVEKDLKAPENLIKNTLLQIKDAKEDVDRELTNAYQDLKRESDKAIADTQREVGSRLKTVGAALEAAGQPKNLARIAVVYAATLYAGPYGAALANTMLDKMENPGMSEEDMLKSFAIGLAAGRAAEYVGGASMKYTNAEQSVVRNLTRDLGEVVLNGKPYRAEDLFTSLATGATTLDGSDSYTERIMNSAITSGKDYSLRQAINHEDIEPDELSKQMATGLAEGTMTEIVHGYIDANHKKALDQRVDQKMEEELGGFLKDLFSAVDEDQINDFNQMYENLTPAEAKRADELVKKEYQEFLEFVADSLGKDVSELTAQDFQSPAMDKLIEQYQIKIAKSKSGENPELDEVEDLLNKEGLAQKDGRNPAFMKHLLASVIIVQVYMIGDTAADYVEKYEEHIAEGGTPESFKEKYGAEIAIDVSIEIASMIPVMKVLKGLKPKQISKVINAARKLGLKTKDGIKDFADLSKRILGDEVGAVGDLSKVIKGKITRFSPIKKGPLSKIPTDSGNTVADTFRSSSYFETVTEEPTKLYRVFDENTSELSAYYSRVKPSGPGQATLDAALDPKWGNTSKKWVEITVPPKETIYDGIVSEVPLRRGGQQISTGKILGGGSQVYFNKKVPRSWITDGGDF